MKGAFRPSAFFRQNDEAAVTCHLYSMLCSGRDSLGAQLASAPKVESRAQEKL